MRANAIYACIAENAGEITFDAGDTLVDVRSSPEDGWFEGTVQATGERGLFPVVYAELSPEVGDDMAFLQRLQADGLLSSTLRLEAFKRELDGGRLPPPLPQKSSAVKARATAWDTSAAAPAIPSKPQGLDTKPAGGAGSGYRPPPPAAPKPKLQFNHGGTEDPETTRQREAEAAQAWEAAHLGKQQTAAAPPLPQKPLSIDRNDLETRRLKEREEAENWEAQHRIGTKPQLNAGPPAPPSSLRPAINPASKPVAGTKPLFLSNRPTPVPKPPKPTTAKPVVPTKPEIAEKPRISQVSHPATENDAPALPYNPSRRPIPDPSTQQSTLPTSNPALENTPPPLPYHPSRRAVPEPVKPIEDAIQPHPKNLISRINTERGSTLSRSSSAASKNGFEDNFDPKSYTPSAGVPGFAAARSAISTSSPSTPPSMAGSIASTPPSLYNQQPPQLPPATTTVGTSRIPLTAHREVKGTGPPVPHRRAVPRPNPPPIPEPAGLIHPALPPKPAALTRHATYSQQPSYPQHPLPRSGSVSMKSPRSSVIHPSMYPATGDAIPDDALTRYSHLFKQLDKQHGKRGYLMSEEVQAVVGRSRLPDDQLRRIWALSDRGLNGRFGPGEFKIIMHLTDCALRHDPIPDVLSVDLIKSAYSQ